MSAFDKYFSVVYEDNHLIIVNKKSGVLVQGDETGDLPLSEHVKAFLKAKYNKPGNVFAGVVHRLDRPVSGLVILAKTSKALDRMNALFRDKQIQKTYWAIVSRKPALTKNTLVHWLIKDRQKNITKAYAKEKPEGQRSELAYSLIAEKAEYYLLEVTPKTGRPHQIRVQLASMQCPIVGDVKYGYPEANSNGSICLHAQALEFIHPIKKEPIKIFAGLPPDTNWNLFREIQKNNLL